MTTTNRLKYSALAVANQIQEWKNRSSTMDLISVIIPCYNQAHFLSEAIESVLAQTYNCFEIIVVDDGSTDNTPEVATRYTSVHYIHQSNQGLAAARNTGITKSRGDYLVFLDADDRLLPNALETGLCCLHRNPESAFASGHHRFIGIDGSLLKEFLPVKLEVCNYRTLLRGNYIGMHATVMYRREVLFSVNGFNPSLAACEDYELYLRIARRYPVCRHDVVVAEYRLHNANMSLNAELMLKSALFILHSQLKYIRGDYNNKKAYRQGMRSWRELYGEELFLQAVHMLKCREYSRAVRATILLLQYAPRYFTIRTYKKILSYFIRSGI